MQIGRAMHRSWVIARIENVSSANWNEDTNRIEHERIQWTGSVNESFKNENWWNVVENLGEDFYLAP